jgi:hypothetical protein
LREEALMEEEKADEEVMLRLRLLPQTDKAQR